MVGELKPNEAYTPGWVLEGLGKDTLSRVKKIASVGGITSRSYGDGIAWRSDYGPPDYIRAESLYGRDGNLRSEASALLRGPVDESTAEGIRTSVITTLETHGVHSFPTNLSAAAIKFITDRDTLAVVNWLQDQYDNKLRIWRMVSTETYTRREYFWKMLARSAIDERPLASYFADGSLGNSNVQTGGLSLFPGLLPTAPLLARLQPLAAVFNTYSGAEIVIMPPQGGFTRPQEMSGFPVSLGAPQWGGGGDRAKYRTSQTTFPQEWGSPLLIDLIARANGLIRWATDPAVWRKESGEIDPVEQATAYATLRSGFGAIHEIARTWVDTQEMWTAFRALGTLAGWWESSINDRLLHHLLDPEVVRQYAIPDSMPESWQVWASDIVDRYTDELQALFPDESIENAVDAVIEVRNLVHGIAAQKTKKRDRHHRLQVLQSLGEGSFVHLMDLAAFWWTSVLCDPATNFVPLRPPFRDANPKQPSHRADRSKVAASSTPR